MSHPALLTEKTGDAYVQLWSLSTAETEQVESLAAAQGYNRRGASLGLEEDCNLSADWFSATVAALEEKGAAAEAVVLGTTLPPPLNGKSLSWWQGRPHIDAVTSRRSYLDDDYSARYRAVAGRMTAGGPLIRGECVAELHARTDALWQRVGWEVERLADDPDLAGWLRATWFEMQSAADRLREGGTSLRDARTGWETLTDRIGSGAPIPIVLSGAWILLRDSLGLDDVFCRGQLSGLAYILRRREPAVLRLAEVRDALDLYDPLLEAAILDRPPLSDEAMRRAEAQRLERRAEQGSLPSGLRWTHLDFARLVVTRYFATPEGEKRSWRKAHDDEDEAQRESGGTPFTSPESFERSPSKKKAEAEHRASQG